MKIISELCQNHNGDRDLLERMIKNAAVSSDIVKIQSIKAETLKVKRVRAIKRRRKVFYYKM